MRPDDYRTAALQTENVDYQSVSQRLVPGSLRILHGALGVADEAGEIVKTVKAYAFYGQPIDEINLIEECGDLLWFVNLILDQIGATIPEAMEANIAKLSKRYPSGSFDENNAINRDTESEANAVEAAGTADDLTVQVMGPNGPVDVGIGTRLSAYRPIHHGGKGSGNQCTLIGITVDPGTGRKLIAVRWANGSTIGSQWPGSYFVRRDGSALNRQERPSPCEGRDLSFGDQSRCGPQRPAD